MSMIFRVEVSPLATNFGHVSFNTTTQETIDTAYNIIAEDCNSALHKKYGNWEVAKKCLDTALDYLKQSNTAFHMLVVKKTADLSRNKNSLMFVSHGVSFIDYLLDISPVNPLPPHYYCPECKHTEVSDAASDGFDLPIKICPNCRKEMLRDGHNCSEAICWRVSSNCKYRKYELQITDTVLLELQSYLDSCLCNNEADNQDDYCSITVISKQQFNQLEALHNSTKKTFDDIPLDNHGMWVKTAQSILKDRKSNFYNYADQTRSFYDLLRIVGLEYMNEINKNIGMLYDSKYYIFRDEIFEDNNTKYRSSKSFWIQNFYRVYYMLWYKQHFPEQYQEAINSI